MKKAAVNSTDTTKSRCMQSPSRETSKNKSGRTTVNPKSTVNNNRSNRTRLTRTGRGNEYFTATTPSYYGTIRLNPAVPKPNRVGKATNDVKPSRQRGTLESSDIIALICSGDKMKEDIAIHEIEKLLRSSDNSSKSYFTMETLRKETKRHINEMETYLHHNPWTGHPTMSAIERRGWLLITLTIIQYGPLKVQKPLPARDLAFIEFYGFRSLTLMSDIEESVQKLSVDILHTIAQRIGYSYVHNLKNPLVSKMNGLIKDPTNATSSRVQPGTSVAPRRTEESHIHSMLIKCFKFLTVFAKYYTSEFVKDIDNSLLEVIFAGLQYPYVPVREVTYGLCMEIVNTQLVRECPFGLRFTYKMLEGFSDSSSAVRIACCLTIKALFLTVQEDERDAYFEAIIPPLCLSRYFTTDTKFMLLCQSVWKEIMRENGVYYVSRYLSNVVTFYALSLQSPNLGVQLAAAKSIAELASKVPINEIAGSVVVLLDALEKAITTNDWQTSDAAVLTLGSFILNHRERSRPYVLHLLRVLFDKLGYPIAQVRKGASATIANIVTAYQTDFLGEIVTHIKNGLKDMSVQKFTVDAQVDGKFLSSVFTFGLPPKPDNMDNNRAPEPWEKADGCLYLIGDLCNEDICQEYLPRFLPLIFQATHNKFYRGHVTLLETACKIIPLLYVGLGKTLFKDNIDHFFDIIFYIIELNNEASAYGRMCLDEISKHIGRGILRGRVKLYNPKYLPYCDGSMF